MARHFLRPSKIFLSLKDVMLQKIVIRRYYLSEERRVVVTGVGCICASGSDAYSAWQNILNGKCAIKKLTDPAFKDIPCRIGGLIDKSKVRGLDRFDQYTSLSESTKIMFVAIAEAITDAGLNFSDPKFGRTVGISLGTSIMDTDDFFQSFKKFEEGGMSEIDEFILFRLLTHSASSLVGYKYNITGPLLVPNIGGATGLVAIGEAMRFLRTERSVDVMICGACEYGLSPYFIASMAKINALNVNHNDNPEIACRPFDKDRSGEVLSEGCGILILEDLRHALIRNARIYCEVKGFGVITAGMETKKGVKAAMNAALIDAKVLPDQVSYVNANGVSSIIADKMEALAIQEFFGDRSWELFVSSTKGAHGQAMSASPSIETVFTALAIYEGVLPPTLNFNNETNEFILNFIPNEKIEYYSKRRIILKNTFILTGVCCSLCMAQIDTSTIVIQ